jgi:hypothetical protein
VLPATGSGQGGFCADKAELDRAGAAGKTQQQSRKAKPASKVGRLAFDDASKENVRNAPDAHALALPHKGVHRGKMALQRRDNAQMRF